MPENAQATSSSAPTSERDLLARLHFGRDDAENDFRDGGLLQEGFLRTSAFEEALSGRKTLIIGRKGSGKSATCLMVHKALSLENRVSLITPDEISADEIRRFHLAGISLQLSKELIWRYVFAVQFAKYLLEAAKKAGIAVAEHSELSAMRQFLVDNNEVDNLTVLEKFWKIIDRLKGSLKIGALGAEVNTELAAAPPGIQVDDQLRSIEACLRSASAKMDQATPEKPFHILVDQVEQVWSDDRDSDAMVVGLLKAAKQTRDRLGPVLCTVFLRTDIYTQLQFPDRDKLRGDEFHIDWDRESLSQLLLARARASSGRSELSSAVLWKNVFPSRIDGSDSQGFVISHTLLRPRDAIQLCNLCRDTARKNRHTSISERDALAAASIFSAWKLTDLTSEWRVNYPFLSDLILLLSHSPWIVRRNIFDSRISQVVPDLEVRYPELKGQLNAQRALGILYGTGAIGVKRNGHTLFSYEGGVDNAVRSSDTEFVIHRSFRYALQSTSAVNLRPFEGLAVATDETVLSNVRAGDFAQGVTVGRFRGSRGSRVLVSFGFSIERLNRQLSQTRLPEEVIQDVQARLNAMLTDLRYLGDEDVASARHGVRRIVAHVDELRQRLVEDYPAEENAELRALYVGMLEIIEEFGSFSERGILREY